MDADQGLPLPQRYWAILVVALGITLAVLDGAIANVALPTIARDLNASPADSRCSRSPRSAARSPGR